MDTPHTSQKMTEWAFNAGMGATYTITARSKIYYYYYYYDIYMRTKVVFKAQVVKLDFKLTI